MLWTRIVTSPSVVFFFFALLPLSLAQNLPLPPLDGLSTSSYHGHHHHPSFEPVQLSPLAPPARDDRRVVVTGGGAIIGGDAAVGIKGRDRPPPLNRATRALRRLLSHARGLFEDGRNWAEDNDIRLRRDLLQGYDRGSFPWDWERNSTYSKINSKPTFDEDANTNANAESSSASKHNPLEVEFEIMFQRIVDVNVQKSTFDALVWIRMEWTDRRLAWDPSSYGGINMTTFWIGHNGGPGGETSEIWTPDIELWNMNEGFGSSLTQQSAIVNSDGRVFWSRPGHLRPMCEFKGLEKFPFDELACEVEIGSWSRNGEQIWPVKMGEGYSFGSSDTSITSGQGSSEFEFKKEMTVSEHLYPSLSNSGNEWPSLIYTVVLIRSSEEYIRTYFILQIMLNLTAFATFWMPPQCGERIGLSITSLLASVASELVVSDKLPKGSEWTIFSRFSFFSLLCSFLAVMECTVVLYFFYITNDTLVPSLVPLAKRKCQKWMEGHNNIAFDKKKDKNFKECFDDNELQLSILGKTIDFAINSKEEGNEQNSSFEIKHNELELSTMKATSMQESSDFFSVPKGKTARFALDSQEVNEQNDSVKNEYSPTEADCDFKFKKDALKNMKWRCLSHKIDDVCRVLFLTVYVVIMAVILRPAFP